MKRTDFEHTIRAAGAILGVSEVLVIGSQAIHASVNFEIEVAHRSIETDISALDDDDGKKAPKKRPNAPRKKQVSKKRVTEGSRKRFHRHGH